MIVAKLSGNNANFSTKVKWLDLATQVNTMLVEH